MTTLDRDLAGEEILGDSELDPYAAHHAEALASMQKLRRLWVELGLAGPGYRTFWRLLRLWPDDTTGQAGASDTDTVGAG